MESENTEIPLHADVKTEVETINQLQTNSMLIGLQTDTLQEDQKVLVMKHEPYNGAGTQQQDTGHDTRSEERKDNVQSSETREKPKDEVSNGHLQIHGIGNYQTQDTIYDQLTPDVKDVMHILDHTYHIQTKKCMYDQRIQIYNDPSNSNDVWEFLPIQDPRSNHQTQDSTNSHPSQDMKHWTVTSAGLLPCVKPEGDRTCMTRKNYPDDTKGMLIKSDGWSLDKNSNAEVAEHSEADWNLTTQMPVPGVGSTCTPPIVIQPEQPVLTQPNHFQTDDVKTASERQLSSYRNSLCSEKSNVTTLSRQSPILPLNIPQSLPSHMCSLPVETPYKCTLCDKALTCKGSLLSHQRTHSETKPLKAFTHTSSLIRHQWTHSFTKPYKCTFCGKGFSRPSDLARHELVHTGEKPYKCDVCEKRFISKGNLKTHQRRHPGGKPYKCDVCAKVFGSPSHLKSHQRTHTGEKAYTCTVCGKWFLQHGYLTAHKRIHTGEKPYKCDVCEKRFTFKGDMKMHQQTHTGEKPHKCTVCDKAFSRRNNLTRHESIHTGEKPYQCNVCDKRFFSKANLKTHQRTHTGEKPYKCTVCGKQFTRSSDVARHRRTHSGEKRV